MTLAPISDRQLKILNEEDYKEYQLLYEELTGVSLPEDRAYRALHKERMVRPEISVEKRIISRKLIGESADRMPITIEDFCRFTTRAKIQTEKEKIEKQSGILLALCPGTNTISYAIKQYSKIFIRRKPRLTLMGYEDPYNAAQLTLRSPLAYMLIAKNTERKETFKILLDSVEDFNYFLLGY